MPKDTESSELQKVISSIIMADMPLPQKAKIISLMALPFLQGFLKDDGLETIAEGAEALYDALGDIGPGDYLKASLIVSMLPREQIKETLAKAFASETSYKKALENVKAQRAFTMGLKVKDVVAVSKALNEVTPPRLRAFLDEASGTVGQSQEAGVRKSRALYRNNTDEQLARKAVLKSKNFPVEQLTDAIYSVTQKATPDRLRTLTETFKQSVSAQDFKELGQNGALFANGLLEAFAAGTNVVSALESSTHAGAFKSQLAKVLSGLETAIITADLVPDTAPLIAALETYRKIDLPAHKP